MYILESDIFEIDDKYVFIVFFETNKMFIYICFEKNNKYIFIVFFETNINKHLICTSEINFFRIQYPYVFV